MNKLDMETKKIVNENIENIIALFPNVRIMDDDREKIDFDALKQELSNDIIGETTEKYRLSWPGKKDSIVLANTPSTNTLRPIKEKSKNFNMADNIYIEGDNLEALKLLQESYLHKIQVVYIDPPYNRGSDLIYKDSYGQSLMKEKIESGEIDEDGNRLITNTGADGRFHSKWLSMMYSRLKLAKNLLTSDGTIFISIDDNEQANLKLICDEIFGQSNYITSIPRICSFQRSGQERYMNISHDYILCYSYNEDFNSIIKRDIDESKIKTDKNGMYIPGDTKAIFAALSQGYSSGGDYDFEYNGKVYKPEDANGNRNRWLWTKERMQAAADLGILVETGRTLRMQLYLDKKFEEGTNKLIDRDNNLKFHTADFMKEKFDNPIGTKELKNIFDGKEYFDNPKPSNLIKYLVNLASNKNGIILDFFSGSATTADAVMQLNKEDNGNRKYILVQVEQKIDESESAYKDGYRFLTDVGEERIRRVISKLDYNNGFRVFKIDSSNMKDDFYKTPGELDQTQLKLFETNIKEDRSADDLLAGVILDLGLTLDYKVEEKNIKENKVYFVNGNELVACFDEDINIDIIDEISKIEPLMAVFRDDSFKTDSDKINLEERFKKLSPNTKISIL